MSASQTPHYGLNQWSPEDQFLRVEFNADNAKTDAALAALASSVGEKAAQADLAALAAAVEGKAEQTALSSLVQTVNGKAAQSALDSLTATVNKKANQSDLTALTTTVNKKANQSDLTALTQTVNTKANQSALNSLTQTVNTKAAQSSLNSLTAVVNGKGNCRIATGSYTGSGVYGSSNPNSISFPFVPLLVIIQSSGGPGIIMTAYSPEISAVFGNYQCLWKVTWNGTSISWYANSAHHSNGASYSLDVDCQCNRSGVVYRYIALGSAG